jgi:hypothetical protein
LVSNEINGLDGIGKEMRIRVGVSLGAFVRNWMD